MSVLRKPSLLLRLWTVQAHRSPRSQQQQIMEIRPNAPYVKGAIQINPATKYPVTMHVTPPATVPQGYTVNPGRFSLKGPPNTTTTTIYYPFPTGTLRVLVTGKTFTPPVVVSTTTTTVRTVQISTKNLSVGAHTLTAVYSGNGVYLPGTASSTFTVTAATPGRRCSSANRTIHRPWRVSDRWSPQRLFRRQRPPVR